MGKRCGRRRMHVLVSPQVRAQSHLLLLTWANILQNCNKVSEIKKIIISFLKLEECGYDQEIYHVTRKQILGTTEINQGIQNRGVALVSQARHNKSPKTSRLKTTETYSLSLEVRSPKSRCQQGLFLLEALRKNPFCASSPASGGHWQSLAFLVCRYVNPVFTSVFALPSPLRGFLSQISLCLSFIRTSVMGFRALPNPG